MAEQERARGASVRLASLLSLDQPYVAQLEQAASAWRSEQHSALHTLVTDVLDQSARIIQPLLYRVKLPAGTSTAASRACMRISTIAAS
jgi:hypothetical protein